MSDFKIGDRVRAKRDHWFEDICNGTAQVSFRTHTAPAIYLKTRLVWLPASWFEHVPEIVAELEWSIEDRGTCVCVCRAHGDKVLEEVLYVADTPALRALVAAANKAAPPAAKPEERKCGFPGCEIVDAPLSGHAHGVTAVQAVHCDRCGNFRPITHVCDVPAAKPAVHSDVYSNAGLGTERLDFEFDAKPEVPVEVVLEIMHKRWFQDNGAEQMRAALAERGYAEVKP